MQRSRLICISVYAVRSSILDVVIGLTIGVTGYAMRLLQDERAEPRRGFPSARKIVPAETAVDAWKDAHEWTEFERQS